MQKTEGAAVSELIGLALASFSVLGSQVAMTRILSLKYAANRTFLVVSFAVLGLAVGAGLAHRLRDSAWAPRLAAGGMAVFGVAMGGLLGLFYLNLPASGQIVAVPVPFLGVGLAVATIFSRRTGQAGFYYAVDLAGAAAGAYGAAPLLDRVPAPTAVLFFAAAGMVAAAFLAAFARRRLRAAVAVVLVVALLGAVRLGLPGRVLGRVPIYPARIKDMLLYVADARRSELDPARVPFLESSRWSAFGRTDVINDVARRQSKVLFVDGAAGSSMYEAESRLKGAARAFLERGFGPTVALRLAAPETKRTALAIGSGGGRDVLACRLGGVQHVTAVEVNPDVVAAVRAEAEFNGGIYAGAPDVTTVVEEGRHYLRGAHRHFDLILLAIPVTKRGESYGGFALSESYLFTRESMREYLDHLTPAGRLIIVCHTRQEVGRLINTFLESVGEEDVTPAAAMERLAVFGEQLITVLITAGPRPAAFWQRLAAETRRLQLALPDRRFYYVPGLPAARRGSAVAGSTPALAAIADGEAKAVAMPRSSHSTFEPDMSPVTDDRPFFYFFTQSLPPLVSVVLITGGVVLAVMLGRGARGQPRTPGAAGGGERLLWQLAVAGLGVAFMLVEIAFIQRFVFWFGRPTLALGLLLGTLLLATGAGALLAGGLIRGRLGRVWPLVAGLGLLLLVAFPPAQAAVFRGASGTLGDSLRRSLLITAPLGLLMGLPFPTLLTAAGRREGVSVAWLWGINGVGSVVGSSAAVAVAMLVGYSIAMRLAGAVYLATALAVWRLSTGGAGGRARGGGDGGIGSPGRQDG